MKLKKKTKSNLLKCTAVCIDVCGPLIATITQFPAWVERSAGSTVSGLFIIFALLSAVPAFKAFGSIIKSPSSVMLWGIGLGLLLAVRSIVDEMILICFVGVLSNIVGTALYKLGEGMSTEEENDG